MKYTLAEVANAMPAKVKYFDNASQIKNHCNKRLMLFMKVVMRGEVLWQSNSNSFFWMNS